MLIKHFNDAYFSPSLLNKRLVFVEKPGDESNEGPILDNEDSVDEGSDLPINPGAALDQSSVVMLGASDVFGGISDSTPPVPDSIDEEMRAERAASGDSGVVPLGHNMGFDLGEPTDIHASAAKRKDQVPGGASAEQGPTHYEGSEMGGVRKKHRTLVSAIVNSKIKYEDRIRLPRNADEAMKSIANQAEWPEHREEILSYDQVMEMDKEFGTALKLEEIRMDKQGKKFTPPEHFTVISGRYVIINELGEGGFAKVHMAWDMNPDNPQKKGLVAIKKLTPNTENRFKLAAEEVCFLRQAQKAESKRLPTYIDHGVLIPPENNVEALRRKKILATLFHESSNEEVRASITFRNNSKGIRLRGAEFLDRTKVRFGCGTIKTINEISLMLSHKDWEVTNAHRCTLPGSTLMIVSEYSGDSLHSKMEGSENEQGVWNTEGMSDDAIWKQTVDWLEAFAELGSDLAALHKLGVLHKDIKPGNITVYANRRLRLIDLGIAMDDGKLNTARQGFKVSGTPQFFAPEQIPDPEFRKFIGTTTDWHSLFHTILYFLTGQFLYFDLEDKNDCPGNYDDMIIKIASYAGNPVEKERHQTRVKLALEKRMMPPGLVQFFLTMLEAHPRDRFDPRCLPDAFRHQINLAKNAYDRSKAETETREAAESSEGDDEPLSAEDKEQNEKRLEIINGKKKSIFSIPFDFTKRMFTLAANAVKNKMLRLMEWLGLKKREELEQKIEALDVSRFHEEFQHEDTVRIVDAIMNGGIVLDPDEPILYTDEVGAIWEIHERLTEANIEDWVSEPLLSEAREKDTDGWLLIFPVDQKTGSIKTPPVIITCEELRSGPYEFMNAEEIIEGIKDLPAPEQAYNSDSSIDFFVPFKEVSQHYSMSMESMQQLLALSGLDQTIDYKYIPRGDKLIVFYPNGKAAGRIVFRNTQAQALQEAAQVWGVNTDDIVTQELKLVMPNEAEIKLLEDSVEGDMITTEMTPEQIDKLKRGETLLLKSIEVSGKEIMDAARQATASHVEIIAPRAPIPPTINREAAESPQPEEGKSDFSATARTHEMMPLPVFSLAPPPPIPLAPLPEAPPAPIPPQKLKTPKSIGTVDFDMPHFLAFIPELDTAADDSNGEKPLGHKTEVLPQVSFASFASLVELEKPGTIIVPAPDEAVVKRSEIPTERESSFAIPSLGRAAKKTAPKKKKPAPSAKRAKAKDPEVGSGFSYAEFLDVRGGKSDERAKTPEPTVTEEAAAPAAPSEPEPAIPTLKSSRKESAPEVPETPAAATPQETASAEQAPRVEASRPIRVSAKNRASLFRNPAREKAMGSAFPKGIEEAQKRRAAYLAKKKAKEEGTD